MMVADMQCQFLAGPQNMVFGQIVPVADLPHGEIEPAAYTPKAIAGAHPIDNFSLLLAASASG
jgi:hypothetical protein